ncbi:MAG: ABC transporter ATP-binding protein [Bacteroidales bacterium]|nr:ABC transporter ATP-binding protein [Bacteroidales bacterium]
MPLLELKNLSIGYVDCRPHKVVHESINLLLGRGELTCLLGTNGAGKSTLLKTLGGFQQPLGGEIFLEGKELHLYARKELAQKLGVVLTDRVATGNLTVYELVSFGRYIYTGFFGQLSKEDHRMVKEALACVGIETFAHRNLLELSDGERQKVMIAKSIAQETPLIILDEPTAFLDLSSRVEIMLLLRKLASEQGKTVLLSTHDLDLALQLADKIWLMAKNREIASGIPEDLALSGHFNSFFDKESLSFDIQNGTFKISNQSFKSVSISAKEPVRIWLEKALIRNGYEISNSQTSIHIEANHIGFIITANKISTHVKTLEEVLNQLKSNGL